MAGYTRQSIADIVNGANITAPPLNAEFNQLASAFGVNGHTHDGSDGNSPKIDLTTSVSGYLPQVHGGIGGKNNTQATANPTVNDDYADGYAPGSIWLNTTNGRAFLCVTNTLGNAQWAEAVAISPNNRITPEVDNTVDIGSSTYQFKDIYINGTGYIDAVSGDTLTMTGNSTVGGLLTVTGSIVGSSNLTITGTGYIGGNVTANSNLTVNGTLNATGDVNLGNNTDDTVTIIGRVDSSILPSADGTYSLGSANNEWQNLFIDGTAEIDDLRADTVVISGGTIDNVDIGIGTRGDAAFHTVNATDVYLGGDLEVDDNVEIGTDSSKYVRINSRVRSSLIPHQDNLYDLGDGTHQWRNLSLTGTANIDSLIADTVNLAGGTINGTAIGATVPSTAIFTNLTATGTVDLGSNVNVDGGTIDNTVIGGTNAVAGSFTSVNASVGITGNLTGDVTGNVTGNLTGNVTGDLTGDITGNVTSSGTSTFNNVAISGTLNMDAGTTATIQNLTDPTNAQDAATKNYVDTNDALKLNLAGGSMTGSITMTGGTTVTGVPTPVNASDAAPKSYVDAEISAVIDAAPGALDTLNELAAALGDDANFATTMTNALATKLNLAGGTMTGAIDMGANKITSTYVPVAGADLTNKTYVDQQDALKLNLTGGTLTGNLAMGTNVVTTSTNPTTDSELSRKGYVDQQDALQVSRSGDSMSGTLDMGSNKVTTSYAPVDGVDLTNKTYVDSILQSATAADVSAAEALASEQAAAQSEADALASAQLAEDWATKTSGTVDGTEFSAKYYATVAADQSVDVAGDTMTGDLNMDGNQVQNAILQNATIAYSDITNVQSNVRSEISVSGSLAYDAGTGIISYTQPTNVSTFTNDSAYINLTEARQGISVSGSLGYNSTTGEISYTQPTNVSTFSNDSGYLTSSNNLSELSNVATARTNLGLGTAATSDDTDFDPAGTALALSIALG